ncbi:exocyst complex component 3-like protein 4 isoform 1-T1 [Synchiropus picturatus]
MADRGSQVIEDGQSPGSNGTEAGGMLGAFRKSFRQVIEKSPISPKNLVGKLKTDASTSDSAHPEAPPSPSPSTGSTLSSPLRGLSRSRTDPNIAAFSDIMQKKGAFIRRSLRMSKNKSKEKSPRPESVTEECELAEAVEAEEEAEEELEETYTLPEIPTTPLSVMQINKLIEMEVLEEAHLNLLALRLEFQQEWKSCGGGDSTVEFAKKEKDLNLLYGELRNKINTIVRDSNSLPSRNKGLLVHVARIIQEEDRRSQEAGGLPGSWMEAWKEAVCEGVKAKVKNVHLEQSEHNASWLSVHLGLLGSAIVQDLENVKRDLSGSYPPSFSVFSTYVSSYNSVIGQHVKTLEQQATELKDLYALLDWIIHRYQSEKIMGSISLQPNMKNESAEITLEENFLLQLREKYCSRVKVDLRACLDRVIRSESEEVWANRMSPATDDNYLDSQFHMDLWTNIKGRVRNSQTIDPELGQQVAASSLSELKDFPKRFESEFRSHCSALKHEPLWTDYQITYVNSFTALQEHMEEYQSMSPLQMEGLKREVKWLITRLLQDMEDQFKEDVKPFLRRMMTRKWLTNDDDFKKLESRTARLADHCSVMRPPHAQALASRLHFHVVKEYIGQLMKGNYSCKNRKHEAAAKKIQQQWVQLVDLFEDMNSPHDWLHPVGHDLSNVIKQRNKADIKNHLQPLVEHYPDFSRKNLVAVLHFRGLMRGREHQSILQKLSELKRNVNPAEINKHQVLFSDMLVSVNTDCLSNLPFSCLSFLLPS